LVKSETRVVGIKEEVGRFAMHILYYFIFFVMDFLSFLSL